MSGVRKEKYKNSRRHSPSALAGIGGAFAKTNKLQVSKFKSELIDKNNDILKTEWQSLEGTVLSDEDIVSPLGSEDWAACKVKVKTKNN